MYVCEFLSVFKYYVFVASQVPAENPLYLLHITRINQLGLLSLVPTLRRIYIHGSVSEFELSARLALDMYGASL